MELNEIKVGMSLYFWDEYDVECGHVIGFSHDGSVILNVMGIETVMSPDCLYDNPADAR